MSDGLLRLPSRILGIFAHPDDEVIGAGGLLLKNRLLGGFSHIICLGGISKSRRVELAHACKLLGITFEVFKKRELTYSIDERATLLRLKKLIIKYRPDYIVTHRESGDYHLDHQTTTKLVFRAARMAHTPLKGCTVKGLLLTEGHFLHEVFHVSVDVTDQFPLIRQALLAHKSQIIKNNGYYLDLMEARLKLRGIQSGCLYAEVFQFVPLPLVGSFKRKNLSV